MLNSSASSALLCLRHGGHDVVELDGSCAAWEAWKETGEPANAQPRAHDTGGGPGPGPPRVATPGGVLSWRFALD